MEARLHPILSAFRHRNYRLFFGGQLISLTGTWMQSAAQAWLVSQLTDSALLLGLVAFAGQIPVFLLAPLGGSTADRMSRRRILLSVQLVGMVLAFALAALTLSGQVQVWHIFIFAALSGVTGAFDIPARQVFVVELVGKEDLLNAIALNSSVFNIARILGPTLAGVIVATAGEGWCFFANGMSYLAVITGLLAMRIAPRASTAHRGSVLAQITEGFCFIGGNRPIRALLLLLGLSSLMGMPFTVLMPVFAEQILHTGAQGLGILMAASGIGALAGALSLAARRGVQGLGRWVAIASFGFGISLILFSLSRSFWLSAALFIPVGLFMLVQMAASNTLIQVMVPDRLRGRVMAVYSMMFMGMTPLGALLAGALAHPWGAPLTVAAGGMACIAGAVLFAQRLPILRNEARQFIVAQNMTGGGLPNEMTGNNVVSQSQVANSTTVN